MCKSKFIKLSKISKKSDSDAEYIISRMELYIILYIKIKYFTLYKIKYFNVS